MLRQSEIDIVRSALCCLCYEDEYSARPVHINHVNNYLHKYLKPEVLQRTLEVLETLQEFARLPNGYWYPAPLRQVPWIGSSIIIGPHSSQELQRTLHLPIVPAGNGRVLMDEHTDRLPVQVLDAWMGRPSDLIEWSNMVFSEGRSRLMPTTTSGETIEIYVPTEPRRWVTLDRRTELANGMHLCRRSLSNVHKSYFLGQLHSNLLQAEAAMTAEHVRLRYGIDMKHGVINKFTCRFRPEKILIEFGYKLPIAERRLMLAVGISTNPNPNKPAFEIQARFLSAITIELKRLGLVRGAQTT